MLRTAKRYTDGENLFQLERHGMLTKIDLNFLHKRVFRILIGRFNLFITYASYCSKTNKARIASILCSFIQSWIKRLAKELISGNFWTRVHMTQQIKQLNVVLWSFVVLSNGLRWPAAETAVKKFKKCAIKSIELPLLEKINGRAAK